MLLFFYLKIKHIPAINTRNILKNVIKSTRTFVFLKEFIDKKYSEIWKSKNKNHTMYFILTNIGPKVGLIGK